jgi:outer membrane protein assembly factor BamB
MRIRKKCIIIAILLLTIIISVIAFKFISQKSNDVKVLWKFKTDSWVKETPIICEDQVIIGSRNTFYCIERDNGKLKWKIEFDRPIHKLSSLTIKNKIYLLTEGKREIIESAQIISEKPALYCINLDTGKIQWELDSVDIPGLIEFFYGKFVDNYIIYFKDNSIIYLNLNSGEIISKNEIIKSEKLLESEINPIYHITSEGLCCIDIFTHKYIWKTNYRIFPDFIIGSGKIFGCSRDNYLYCIDGKTGKLIWKYLLDNETGEERNGYSHPFLYEGKIYIGGDYTGNHVFCLDSEDGKLIWKYKTEDIVVTSPFVVNEKVYIASSDGFLYCLDAKNGNYIWKYKTDSLFSSPIVASDGKIYIGSIKRCIFCLQEKK